MFGDIFRAKEKPTGQLRTSMDRISTYLLTVHVYMLVMPKMLPFEYGFPADKSTGGAYSPW